VKCTVPEKSDQIRNRGSGATARLPPGTTNRRSATTRPCRSLPSTNGC